MLRFVRYTSKTKEELFAEYTRNEYFEVMDAVIKKHDHERGTPFKSMYGVGFDNAEEAIQMQRRDLVALAVQEDAVEVETELKAEWEQQMQSLPSSMRACISEDSLESYRKQVYFDVLEKVVKQRRCVSSPGTAGRAIPKVEPGDGEGANAAIRQQRELLLQRMKPEDCRRVETGVVTMWRAQVDTAKPGSARIPTQ